VGLTSLVNPVSSTLFPVIKEEAALPLRRNLGTRGISQVTTGVCLDIFKKRKITWSCWI
jgi:hypothetical protein